MIWRIVREQISVIWKDKVVGNVLEPQEETVSIYEETTVFVLNLEVLSYRHLGAYEDLLVLSFHHTKP